MSGVVTVDVSEFQRPVTDSYPHDWFSFRVCDGTYVDRNAAKNLAWARKAAAAGKIAGYTCYCVYRPNTPTLQTVMRVIGQPDDHVTVMVDVESWGGAIRGDHSQAITALANGLGQWLGDRRRVLAYGNHGDLVSLYPTRPSWLRFIVAGYGTQQPAFPNMIGWQYSDGDSRWPTPNGLPRKTRPFGNCDHNVFPGLSPSQLAEALGVAHTTGEMTMDKDVTAAFAALNRRLDALPNQMWGATFADPTDPAGKREYNAATWLVYGNVKAGKALAAAQQATAAAKSVAVDAAAIAADITTRVRKQLADLFGGSQ